MKKITFLAGTFMFALLSCSGKKQKPNIVFFLVDDMGWTDANCLGSDFYQTPNIDKLVSEGMRFTNAYSSCAVCSPTRASIMTGKYPARLHLTTITDAGRGKSVHRLSPPEYKRFMDTSEYTLANAMKDAGYTTIHLGKWHMGREEKYWPENRGFETNIGGWRPGMPIVGPKSNGYFSPYGNPRLTDGMEGEYLTERLTKEALDFLDKQKGKTQPFYMNFWFYTVHLPLQAKPDKIEKYTTLSDTTKRHHNAVYAAMVEHLDDAVGQVMNKLKEAGFDDNTIIIFTSDNGGVLDRPSRYDEIITSNYPLRSGKGDMYEGGVRVPFAIRWKNHIEPLSVNETPVISCDIYPTLLGLTNTAGKPEQNKSMDGQDLSDLLLKNKPLQRDAIFWHFPHYNEFGAKPFSAIRKGNWKLIEVFEYDSLMLFNLEKDISEQMNLASQYPEKANELLEDLRKWRKDVNAQMPVENPDYKP